MITVGLIKELFYISTVFKKEISSIIEIDRHTIMLTVANSFLTVRYKGHWIWREKIEGDTSMFGIESCDAISRIISCIDNNSPWEQYRFIEKS